MSVEIGSYLRQARESIGLSLDQLQEKTKIQKSFLIAIENGEFHKLPSPFYVRTYLRSYANCVKVEPHHILRQYRKEEQAERGLTGVHKVVDEKELAQTKRMPTAKTGKMPVATGPNKALSPGAELRSTANEATRPHRTTANTALTIAKSKSGQAKELPRRDDLARREFGYQRPTSMTRTMNTRPNLERPTVASQPRPIPEGLSASKTTGPIPEPPMVNPPRSMPEELPGSKTLGSIPIPEPLKSKPTPPLKPARNIPTEPPATSNDSVYSSIPPRRNREVQKQNSQRLNPVSSTTTGSGQPLSRSARLKKDLSNASLPPMAPEKHQLQEANESFEPTLQGATRVQSLSRSAVKNRKSSKSNKSSKFPLKKTAIIIAASLAVCVPLAWAAYTFLGDDSAKETPKAVTPKEQKNQAKNAEGDQAGTASEATEGTLKFVGTGKMKQNYKVTGTDELSIVVINSVQGSRAVLRTNQSPNNDKNVIKDVTLDKNVPWSQKYTFPDGQKDLYIFLTNPTSAKVQINGQEVKVASYIHIQKAD